MSVLKSKKKTFKSEKMILTKKVKESIISIRKFFGDENEEEIPVPIPNTEVKLLSAENTNGLPCWEDRKSPNFYFL